GRSGSAVIQPGKRSEHFLPIGFGNTGAVVFNVHPAIVFIEMTNHHHTPSCIACSIAHQVLYRTMNVTGLDIGQRPALGFIINPALDLDTLPNDALLRNHLSHDVRYRTLPKAEYGATLL